MLMSMGVQCSLLMWIACFHCLFLSKLSSWCELLTTKAIMGDYILASRYSIQLSVWFSAVHCFCHLLLVKGQIQCNLAALGKKWKANKPPKISKEWNKLKSFYFISYMKWIPVVKVKWPPPGFDMSQSVCCAVWNSQQVSLWRQNCQRALHGTISCFSRWLWQSLPDSLQLCAIALIHKCPLESNAVPHWGFFSVCTCIHTRKSPGW